MRVLFFVISGAALALLQGCADETGWQDQPRLQLIDCRDGRGKIISEKEFSEDLVRQGTSLTLPETQLLPLR